MPTRDEVIRFLAKVDGKKDVDAMGQSFEDLGKSALKADPAAKQLVDDLARIGKDQSSIQSFVKLKAELTETRDRLGQATTGLAQLRKEFNANDESSGKVAAAFRRAEKAVADLTKAERLQSVELQKTGGALAKAGIDTTKLADADRKLSDESARLTQRLRDIALNGTAAGKGLRDTSDSVDKLNKATKDGAKDSDGLLASLGKIGVLAASIGVALKGVQIGTDAFGGAVAIEQSLSRVQALAKGTVEQFAQLGTKVQEAALEAKVGPEVAAQALAELAGQGQNVDAAFASLIPTLRLAKIAQIEVGAAAGAVDDVLDLFGLSADQAGHAVDVLVAASRGSDEGLAGLQGALAKIAPTARDMGLNLEQTAGILGIFVQNGFSAEKAAKGLLKIFDDLRDPTSDLRQNLADLGDNSGDFATAIETIAGAGEKGKKTLDGLDASARNLVLFLLQQGKGAIADFTKSLQDVDGTAESVAKTLDDNLGGAFKNTKDAFSNLATAFLAPILGPLKDEIELIETALNDFAKTEAFRTLQDALVQFVTTGLAALNQFVAQLDFKKVAEGLANFGTNASTFFTKFRGDIESVASFAGNLLNGIGVAFDGTATVIHTAATAIAGALAGIVKAAALVASLNVGQELNDKLAGVQSTAEKLNELAATLFDSAKANYESAGESAGGFKEKLDALIASLDKGKPAVEGTAAALTTMSAAAVDLPESAEGAVTAIDAIGLAGVRAATGAVGAATAVEAMGEAIGKANTPLEAAKLRLNEAKDALVALQGSAEATPAALAVANAEFQAATLQVQKLTEAQKGNKASTDELLQAYKDLSIVSQADLVTAYDKTVKALDAVIRAEQRGAASSEDVRRAFIAMAEAQLRVVADSDATTRARAENELRVKAATLGVVDALEKLGLAGKKAGDDVAAGAGKATGALEETAASADKAASSAEGLGASSNTAASGLENVATAGNLASESAIGASQAFADASSSILGFDRVQFNLLDEQTRRYQEETAANQASIDALDERRQMLIQVAAEYGNLSEAQQIALANQRMELQQLRQRQQEERQRERDQQSTGSSSGGKASAANIVNNFAFNGGVITGTREQVQEQLARIVAPGLLRLRGRGVDV